jgi:hypothetical protein
MQHWLRRLLGGLGGRAGKKLGLNGLSVPEIWRFEVGVDGGGTPSQGRSTDVLAGKKSSRTKISTYRTGNR